MFARLINRRVQPAPLSLAMDAAQSAADERIVQMEAALRSQQVRFELLREASGEGLWEMVLETTDDGRNRRVFHWSDQLRHLLGLDSADELSDGASWTNRLHPDDRASTLGALDAHLADRSGRTRYDAEYRLQCGDGSYRWFRARCATERDATGRAVRSAGGMCLIDEAKQREVALDVVLTRFSLAREMLSEGIWDVAVTDGDPLHADNVYWWSPQFRRLLGFDSEADFPNVLQSWAARLHPDDADATLGSFIAHVGDQTGMTPYCVEYRLLCKDASYHWFRARGETRRSANGTPMRAVGSLTKIDSEKVAAESDRERGRYQKKLESGLTSIAGIVGNIQEIVRQTDLIALNAAIEAARAGAAGRGFSVIAGEMRQLSLRIGAATADVTRIHRELGQ